MWYDEYGLSLWRTRTREAATTIESKQRFLTKVEYELRMVRKYKKDSKVPLSRQMMVERIPWSSVRSVETIMKDSCDFAIELYDGTSLKLRTSSTENLQSWLDGLPAPAP